MSCRRRRWRASGLVNNSLMALVGGTLAALGAGKNDQLAAYGRLPGWWQLRGIRRCIRWGVGYRAGCGWLFVWAFTLRIAGKIDDVLGCAAAYVEPGIAGYFGESLPSMGVAFGSCLVWRLPALQGFWSGALKVIMGIRLDGTGFEGADVHPQINATRKPIRGLTNNIGSLHRPLCLNAYCGLSFWIVLGISVK